ncbi:helix-turn-helix domain-containing protein [Pedobacter deserti]|uniref:helix-turn-helix domain-containing protein n=1 Tax=Pedobacter deserti TaxID=2817382 RepID=UPI0021086E72|nr:AraC family transcriptional regulator [Pedobacter sp. SYSU D00382]
MKILKQFDPLTITFDPEVRESCARHSHNHFEIVYINKGTGQHFFNDNAQEYRTGDLFLISPGDQHFFEIGAITAFTYIKFNEAYFESKTHLAPAHYYFTPEAIMKLSMLKEIKIEIEHPQSVVLKSIIDSILAYDRVKDVAHSVVVFYLLLGIFGIVREAMQAKQVVATIDDRSNGQVLSYLHENIYRREKLTIKAVAAHFHISVKYFSNYFKRNFDTAYQEYLDNYRIKLIEKRMAIGGIKLKQIAQEFGFTDVSHLSKVFKKLTGLTPTDYKKLLRKKVTSAS